MLSTTKNVENGAMRASIRGKYQGVKECLKYCNSLGFSF